MSAALFFFFNLVLGLVGNESSLILSIKNSGVGGGQGLYRQRNQLLLSVTHGCTNCMNLEMEPKYPTKSNVQL